MGRHGGGSSRGGRSGGGSSRRSGSSSRGRASSPFQLLIIIGIIVSYLNFGGKVNGNPERILIEDRIDILTPTEEAQIISLFEDVYEASGMPVTLITDDYGWKNFYISLEAYSELLYYSFGMEEDAMIIVFTEGENKEFYDWEYDMYCGDDTIKCLSDSAFDKLLDNFQKAMAKEDLCYALDYAWKSVIPDMAKTGFGVGWLVLAGLLLLVCFVFYWLVIRPAIKQRKAYNYPETPEQFTGEPAKFHHTCPNCGASNESRDEFCSFCGKSLTNNDE